VVTAIPGVMAAITRSGKKLPEKIVEEMVASMRHSESSFVNKWFEDSHFIASVEIDNLYGKNDPLYDDGKSLVGVSKGGIFNKEELKSRFGVSSGFSCTNDTRFLIEMYEKDGINFVKRVNGLFSFLIIDRKKDRVVMANDRYGYFPVFLGMNSESIILASEAKTVLKGLAEDPKMNEEAIPEFFAFSYILGDKTFFTNVKKIPPATLLIYEPNVDKLDVSRYWDFSLKKYDRVIPLVDYLKEFNRLMMKSVKRRVSDCKKVGVFLSGGLDSRVLAAFASELSLPVVTYTFGVEGCEEQLIASEVAAALGLENVFLEIPSNFISDYAPFIVYGGDGMIRVRDSHFISLLDKIQDEVDAVLLGTFGGDLTCRPEGRLPDKMLKFRKKSQVIDFLFDYYTNIVSNVLPPSKQGKAFKKPFFCKIHGKTKENFVKTFAEIPFDSATDIGDYWEYRNREPRYIFHASQHMNWFLDTRHPYMDNDLVEFFAFRFPIHLRRREVFGVTFEDTFLQKALNLRFPHLSHITWHGFKPESNLLQVLAVKGIRFVQQNFAHFLEKIIRRRVPTLAIDFRGYGEWLRTGSKEFVLKTLLDQRTLNRPYFCKEFIEKTIADHMSYRADNNQLLCDLINFELMNRMFFDID
jgi:asparagine synthase (glutamine-hydrolysing)